MILSFPGSLRSLWTPVVVSVGLLFSLLGILTATPEPGARLDVAGAAIGVVTGGASCLPAVACA